MFTKSIYFKMTAWYVLVLGFIIGSLSIALYTNFKRDLNKDINNLLESKAEDIAQVIGSYSEEDKTEQGEKKENMALVVSNADFLNALKFAVEKNPKDDVFVQIFSSDGKELIRSSNMPLALISAKRVQDSLEQEDATFDTVKVVLSKKDALFLRKFILFVRENGKISYIIQVLGSLKPIYLHLHRLKTALSVFLPLVMFLAIASSFFLTKRTLKPVDDMTNAMRQITSNNLRHKIEIPKTNDEIKRLAETFNNMLIRLDGAFSNQQQFIQDVSHELRTPLTALKGKQEVALNKKRSPEEYESVLAVNLEEINKMSQLVENLLVLERLENKEPLLKIQPVDLTLMIERILAGMKPLAEQKNIPLLFSSNKQVFIEADGNQIGRVISNIVDNAIKYTPIKGRVNINLCKDNTFAKIVISDTGIGINEDELPRIFDRFYRIDKSRSSSGFGLGLSIAKSIVDAHKGKIEVESHADRGTIFTISLPLVHS